MSFQKYIKESKQEHVIRATALADEAMAMLQQASAKLEEAQKAWEDTGNQTDAFRHFKMAVDEVISTDHGEAGLQAAINSLYDEIEAPQ